MVTFICSRKGRFDGICDEVFGESVRILDVGREWLVSLPSGYGEIREWT